MEPDIAGANAAQACTLVHVRKTATQGLCANRCFARPVLRNSVARKREASIREHHGIATEEIRLCAACGGRSESRDGGDRPRRGGARRCPAGRRRRGAQSAEDPAGADEAGPGAVQSSGRWADVSGGVRRRIPRRRLPPRVGRAAAVGERHAVRRRHVHVEYARLFPVRDAHRIHDDRLVAATQGPPTRQPRCRTWVPRWPVHHVRSHAGNHGGVARASRGQRPRLSCGKLRRRHGRGLGRRGGDAPAAGERHTQTSRQAAGAVRRHDGGRRRVHGRSAGFRVDCGGYAGTACESR